MQEGYVRRAHVPLVLSVQFAEICRPNLCICPMINSYLCTPFVESGIPLSADPSFPLYVLVQSREPAEIQEYVQTLGATAVFVRGGHREENVNSNESDRNVANFSYHYYIDNTGNLAGLDIEVSKFVKWLLDNE